MRWTDGRTRSTGSKPTQTNSTSPRSRSPRIEQGGCKLRRAGGVERAGRLTDWLNALLVNSGDRILPFDGAGGMIAGALADRASAAGRPPGFPDVAIAATAFAHDLALLTCNGRHFQPLDAPFIDPLESLP